MTTKLKPGTTFADRYQILERLGRGGMGTVYSAQHCALSKKFAIKLLHRHLCVDNNALMRFAQEARSASGIEHQNIIDVLDAGRIDNVAFYVMEHLQGEDLQTMFTRESPLPWERIQRITLQICDAMQAAHDRRIIHRDLKPSNLYRITRGNNNDFIKILDFGIAKVRTADDKTRDGLTAVGSILGTLRYMAPEQAKGLKIDHRADIYSLGVIMYHALTGELPFKGSQPAELIEKLLRAPPTPMKEHVEGINPLVEALVLKTLSKDPSDRFPSMHSLAAAIDRIKSVEAPAPCRVRHSRGPLIELDDDSIEFLSENPFPELARDSTTLVRPAGVAENGMPVLHPKRPLSYHRRLPNTKPLVRGADEVATQTNIPGGRRSFMRSSAPWAVGIAVSGFLLVQTWGRALPLGANDVEQDEAAPKLAVPTRAPVQEPVLVRAPAPASNLEPKAAIAVSQSFEPPEIPPEVDASHHEKSQPTRGKGASPNLTSRNKTPTSRREETVEQEVDCNEIQGQTFLAENRGDWVGLYAHASSSCWAGDPRALEWKITAKMKLKHYDECISLGKNSSNIYAAKLARDCETRKLMSLTSDQD